MELNAVGILVYFIWLASWIKELRAARAFSSLILSGRFIVLVFRFTHGPATESLIAADGILEEMITFRKENNYQDPITKRQDGSITIWGHRRERMDWNDRGGFVIAAQLIETFLTE